MVTCFVHIAACKLRECVVGSNCYGDADGFCRFRRHERHRTHHIRHPLKPCTQAASSRPYPLPSAVYYSISAVNAAIDDVFFRSVSFRFDFATRNGKKERGMRMHCYYRWW